MLNQFTESFLRGLQGSLYLTHNGETSFGTNCIDLTIDCSTNTKAINFSLMIATGKWKKSMPITQIEPNSAVTAYTMDILWESHLCPMSWNVVKLNGMASININGSSRT